MGRFFVNYVETNYDYYIPREYFYVPYFIESSEVEAYLKRALTEKFGAEPTEFDYWEEPTIEGEELQILNSVWYAVYVPEHLLYWLEYHEGEIDADDEAWYEEFSKKYTYYTPCTHHDGTHIIKEDFRNGDQILVWAYKK